MKDFRHHAKKIGLYPGSNGKFFSFLWFGSLVTQSCRILSVPMDCSLPSSSVYGILQARILEWVAISFSRGSDLPNPGMEPRSPGLQADSLPSEPPGKTLVASKSPTQASLSKRGNFSEGYGGNSQNSRQIFSLTPEELPLRFASQ